MKSDLPAQLIMDQFPIEDDCLVVGGIKLTRLAERVGKTPFYAYDRGLMTRRVEFLRSQLPDRICIHYAMKANPMPAVVQHMATLVDGMDVASAGEMKIALDTPMPASEISIAGPGKRPEELRQAIAAGITLHIESETEVARITEHATQLGIKPRVAVRINPAFELKASGMKMGGGAKPFGIDEENLPKVLRRIKKLDLEFVGLHIFSGSQNLNADSIITAQKESIALAVRLSECCPAPIRKLNIGGGFGIPYFPGDHPLDLSRIGEALDARIGEMAHALPESRLVLELGRYLVGEAGIYACRVVDRKISRGEVFLITDGGLHHHLAASGNFGQVIRKNYPVVIGNRVHGAPREIANVVGPLCTPLDILASKMDMARADIGDLVVVFQSGAYGLTASPSAFLSQPSAEEILV
ncbi:MAG: pyridoxal-dependent decarboxylase, exosortase A system-associated [Methylococcaceae bacterium]|nr:pyridoxal-dependent decarboxylase, exosortase A system-associated [Methylococcaceae bacterium]